MDSALGHWPPVARDDQGTRAVTRYRRQHGRQGVLTQPDDAARRPRTECKEPAAQVEVRSTRIDELMASRAGVKADGEDG